MKKVKYIFAAFLIFIFTNDTCSQNYFDINNKHIVSIGPLPGGHFNIIPILFALQEVSISYLDITTSFFVQRPVGHYGVGCWTPNSGGNDSFGNHNTFFFEETHLPNYIQFFGNIFVN